MMAVAATVGGGAAGVTPAQLNSLPTRAAVAVSVQLTAAQSALETAAADMVKSLLTVGSTGTSAAALKPAAAVDVLTSAAAISPTSIIQQIIDGVGLFLFGPGATSLLGLSRQVGVVANYALIGVDGAVYQASNALASAVTGAASGLLAPVAAVPPVRAVIAAVSTLLQNLVPPPNGLLSVSGGFGFQLPEIPLNLLTIASSPIKAIGLAVQAFVAALQGATGTSVAAVKNSVAAVPKVDAKTTALALAPTSATDGTKTTAETPKSDGAKSDKTTQSTDTKLDNRTTRSHAKSDPATTLETNTTPDVSTEPDPATKSDKAGKPDSKSSKSDGAKASHRNSGPRHSASGNTHRNAGAHSGGKHSGK